MLCRLPVVISWRKLFSLTGDNSWLILFVLLLFSLYSVHGKQKTYRFGILSSRTLLAICNDTASTYMAEQQALGHSVAITCYSTELAAQLGVIQARDIPTIIKTPVATADGQNASAADVDYMTLFFLRTIFTNTELNNNSERFVAYPVLANGAVVGYNLPDLEPGNIGGLDAKADPVVLRLSQPVITGIFSGKIKTWDDPAITSSNPDFSRLTNKKLPSKAILFGVRSDRFVTSMIASRALYSMDNVTFGKAFTSEGLQAGADLKKNLTNKIAASLNTTIFTSVTGSSFSLFGGLQATQYSMIMTMQEDLENYGFRVAAIQNQAGLYTTSDRDSIQAAVTNASQDPSSANFSFSMSNLGGNGSYPFIDRVYLGVMKYKVGQATTVLPDCDTMAATFRFVNWLLDSSSTLAESSFTRNYYVKSPQSWYQGLEDMENTLRCGDRRQKVSTFMDEIATNVQLIAALNNPATWGEVVAGLILGGAAAWYFGRKIFVFLNRLRKESMEQYAISSKNIRLTPTLYSPVDRYKGVVASRRVVDRYIPLASLQCITTGTWGEHEVFLRPCSLVIHRLNHRARMKVLELAEISQHKNVVMFYGLTELPAGRCLVCNFCPFGDLRTLIISKKHVFSMNTKFSLTGDICEGMEYLHNCGIIHGNLRSCAVYIEANWTAKISDYEYDAVHQVQGSFHPTVAQLKQKLSLYQQTSLYPWLYWTAPEILRQGITGREIPPEKSADTYSFGIVCSEIFAMEPAYQKYQELPYKLNPAQILNGILSADMRPREDWKATSTPRCVLRVMEHCWQENASHRPSFHRLKRLFRAVQSMRRHVADKIMIAAEKTSETVKNRCEAATQRLNRFDNEFHKYSKILVPPAYWRSIYKQKLYMSITRHKLGIVFICNLVDYSSLINAERTAKAIESVNLLHQGFQNLIEKGGRVYRVYRNGTCFVALGNVPYGIKEDPIDSIAQLAFDFMTWAWKVKVPANIMDGFHLQIGIHSGPMAAGTLKHSTNQFIALGMVQKEAWNIARSSAPCRILISEEFHQNLRQLAQIFIKYRIVPNTEPVFGYTGKTYWLVGMNYYRAQSLLDDIFALDPENLEALAKWHEKKQSRKKEKKGILANELIKTVSALPFDYQALTAGGNTQYLVDVPDAGDEDHSAEKPKPATPRGGRRSIVAGNPRSISYQAAKAGLDQGEPEEELVVDTREPPFMEATVLTTRGSQQGLGAKVSLKELKSADLIQNTSVKSLLNTPEAQASLKKLRQQKRKEQKELLDKQDEQKSRLELSRAKSARSDAETDNMLRSMMSQETERDLLPATLSRRIPSIKASRSEAMLGSGNSRRENQDGLSRSQTSNISVAVRRRRPSDLQRSLTQQASSSSVELSKPAEAKERKPVADDERQLSRVLSAESTAGYLVQQLQNATNQYKQGTDDDLEQVTTPLMEAETDETNESDEDDDLVKHKKKSKSRKKKMKK